MFYQGKLVEEFSKRSKDAANKDTTKAFFKNLKVLLLSHVGIKYSIVYS